MKHSGSSIITDGSTTETPLPEFRQIFDGEQSSGSITQGGATVTFDTTVKESGESSLKIVLGADVGTTVSLDLTDSARALGEVCFRVRSPDWTKMTYIRPRLFESSDHSGGAHWCSPWFSDTGGTVFGTYGMQSYPWSADTWRTVRTVCEEYTIRDDPTDWGTSFSTREKTIGSLQFYVKAGSSGGTFYIDRIYAPVWDKAMICVILDGFYSGAREKVFNPFVSRGWRGSARVYNTSGIGIYPSWADFRNCQSAGWDIGRHYHDLSGGSFDATTTPADLSYAIGYWNKDLRNNLGSAWAKGSQSATFLGNNGKYNGTGFARILREKGISSARALCSDDVFEFDPYNGHTTTIKSGPVTGHVSSRGPYNYPSLAASTTFTGSSTSFAERDNFSATWEDGIRRVLDQKLCAVFYIHNVTPYVEGVSPSVYDVGETFVSDMIAYLDSRSDEFNTGSIQDLYDMTYGRQGEFYVDQCGEWRSSRKPDAVIT